MLYLSLSMCFHHHDSVTGRKGRFVDDGEGGLVYQRRNEGLNVTLLDINIKEKELFNNGSKRVAVISEAGM